MTRPLSQQLAALAAETADRAMADALRAAVHEAGARRLAASIRGPRKGDPRVVATVDGERVS